MLHIVNDYGNSIFFCVALQLSVSIEVPGDVAYHFQPRLFGKVRLKFHTVESSCINNSIGSEHLGMD